MKLLFYHGGFAAVGGIEHFVADLSLALTQLGHSCSVLCWGRDCYALHQLKQLGVYVKRRSFRWACRFGLPDLALIPSAVPLLRRADAVVLGKLFAPPVMGVIRRLARGVPFVYVTPYRPADLWKRSRARDELASVDAVVVQEESFAEELRSAGYLGRVRVLPYLAPKVRRPAGLPPGDPKVQIGFLGRLAAQKNLGYALEVLQLLSPTKFALHLFGEGGEEPSLRAMCSRLRLAERVFFHGRRPRDRVHEAIDVCHFFILTSVAEGQCLAALEIFSRGRRIVSTPVGALRDILTKEPLLGRIGPLADPSAFAAAVRAVTDELSKPAFSPRQVQKAYERLFTPELLPRMYEEFFATLVAKSRI